MKTIVIEMSEQDYERFADESGTITFETLRERVLADALQTSLDDVVQSARRNGLNNMTLAEIDAEVRAVRNQHG